MTQIKVELHTLKYPFQENTIDFSSFTKTKSNKKYIKTLPKANIEYLDNEMRWYLQTQYEKGKSASTLSDCIDIFISRFIRFSNEIYPKLDTVIRIDLDELLETFKSWSVKNGYKIMTKAGAKTHISKDMEWKTYDVPTDTIYNLGRYYRFVHDYYYPNNEDEYDKDIWDIRNLGIPYQILPSRPRYTINYSKISQKWLVEAIKRYNLYRIPRRAISTVLDDIKAFNLFSEFLRDREGKLNGLAEIDRNVGVEFISYVRSKGYVSTTMNRRISALKTFFEIGNILEIKGIPVRKVFINDDFVKRVKHMPIPFSDNELRQLNRNIHKLPKQIANIFFIIERCGMRMSDICSATILNDGEYCLKKIGQGYLFTYYQRKTHKYNTVSVDEIVATTIENSIEESRSLFGDKCIYIFSKSEAEPISQESFVYYMNHLSKENNIIADNGKILRIKGHTFRRTFATDYANMGVSMDVIRMMLGQSKLDVLVNYIKIHSDDMKLYMSGILEEDDELINNIGVNQVEMVDEPVNSELFIPLSNGWCKKSISSGICEHANACYGCTMFKPAKNRIGLYRKQLKNVENNILMAQINGYERLLEQNEKLKEQLLVIIDDIEKENCLSYIN